MNISFTEKQEEYIKNLVASGDYKNASEVVREAIRLHSTADYEKKLAILRSEIQKGIDSGYSDRSVLDIIAEKRAKYQKKGA